LTSPRTLRPFGRSRRGSSPRWTSRDAVDRPPAPRSARCPVCVSIHCAPSATGRTA
jgi:hypothetical protein